MKPDLKDLNVFWVFAGDNYYPNRAIQDLRGAFQTQDDANQYADSIENAFEWVRVVNVSDWL